MTLTFSRRFAWILGTVLPVVETMRRWHQMGQWHMLPAWLDDYLLAALLLVGAWRALPGLRCDPRYLAAAWGCACGMGYFSFFGQLSRLDEPDPGPLPTAWVVGIKGVGLLLALAALVGSLRRSQQQR